MLRLSQILGVNQSLPNYLKAFILLGVAASSPFVCVMIINVVKPIFVENMFDSPAEVLAWSSIFYTLGAAVSGFSGNYVSNDKIANLLAVISITIFSFSAIFISFVSTVWSLYVCSIIWGVTNGLSRISYQTVVMRNVDNTVIGGVFTKIQVYLGIERSLTLLLYTALGAFIGFSHSFYFVAIVALSGLPLMVIFILMPKDYSIVERQPYS